MAAANMSHELPPLPEYTLKPLPPLVPWASDAALQVALPIIAYWVVSGMYHFIDVYDLLSQYRLHTPAEVLKRNHVSRYEVFRDVIIQQVIQTVAGLLLSMTDAPATYGTADYDVAWYAQKIRLAQRAIPAVLATVGLNPSALASKVSASQPMLASALSGGRYELVQTILVAGQPTVAPAFASWELTLASILYWYAVPALQFAAGVLIIDTWEYALHRAMHMNKWLYATFHSRHHRLYVPYAYGALYNHPFEGFLLDTLGAGLAYLITGMTLRQSLFFFTGSTIKTVLDHSGYEFPWDPLHFIFPNNAAYHDIHHQSWGIKTNFSQPFFIFWDRIGGTMFEGDAEAKYARARRTAEQKMAQETENAAAPPENVPAITSALDNDENARPQNASVPRVTRKKSSSLSGSPAGNLKGLRNKVNESLHGKGGNVLGMERSR
ncbi:sphinganine hydroxylase-like protein Sur2 [Lentithecium fluviatile CBS 122367]|uniref:Sphinganine hydroxylase-like protein Sur2 n=1 Tax=Lentithecium fluviatile CBS 122367 TaxID=1168545 RepID=A0A6G1IIR3_9PLEO|nr:sphinganine hydroxylase-like protein Sur2 [Lentithecium fluviatile CBS 122367]